MGKGSKQQLQEYQFDEASSGSDDNDSSDEEDQDKLHSMNRRGQKDLSGGNQIDSTGKDGIAYDSSDDDNNKYDNDDHDDSGSDSRGGGADDSADSENEEEYNDNRGLDDESDHEQKGESSNEEDAPLHRRLLKKEGRGSMQRSSRRERKSRALEEATKRLASFKEIQLKKKKRMARGIQDDESAEKSTSRKITNIMVSKKKRSKNKPTEVSSKRADFFARGARRLNESGIGVDIGAHRYKPMDPRASNLSGHFDEDRFNNNYAFLEEIRNREIGQVRKRIAAHKATGNKGNRQRRKLQIIEADGSHSSTLEDDVARLKALTETRANLERRKIDRAARQSVKRKIRDDVESGKTGAYFLKRKEKKRLELEARFEEIQKRGGEKAVEKILAKKRQKNKSRDAGGFAK